MRAKRTHELYHSASNLGLQSPRDVTIIDDEESFPDSMTTFWSAENVAKVLASRYNSEESLAAGRSLDILITFDDHGISSHANHISLLHGAQHWIRQMSPQMPKPIALYTLTTTNIVRKYISLLDAPVSLLLYLARRKSTDTTDSGLPDRYLFFSHFSSYRRAQRSMTTCHKSQMLWFRYAWIMLSRYVSTNDLKRQYI